MMKKIAIIPARGGSKGVPGKNLKLIGGVSLLGRAIKAALESELFDEVVVSTDDSLIEYEARKWGVKVIQRPTELSGDGAKTFSAVEHALDILQCKEGICCLLQPTSPLRTGNDIKRAFEVLRKNEFDTVVSICESEHHPYKTVMLKDGRYAPLISQYFFEMPRQELEKAFRINGAIYFNKIKNLLAEKSFFSGVVGYVEMGNVESIDIDSEIDIFLANALIERCGNE